MSSLLTEEFIPVEIIVGFLNFAVCSINGRLLHSPEPILSFNRNFLTNQLLEQKMGTKKLFLFYRNIF